jgi:hypothetical protein
VEKDKMSDFKNTILSDQPHDYYCLVTETRSNDAIELPRMLTEDDILYVSNPLRVFNSEKFADKACTTGEKPLYLICLACFLNIIRTRLRIKKMILNNLFLCQVDAWRTPCQTTATFEHSGQTYFIEGCQESGVFWKNTQDKAITTPPFLQCGTTYLDCIWNECPNGWEYFEDEPITLCKITENPIVSDGKDEDCIVSVQMNGTTLYYAGISEEGFDFARDQMSAIRLSFTESRNLAKAIANVHMNWSQGMLAQESECEISVLNNGKDVLSIVPYR